MDVAKFRTDFPEFAEACQPAQMLTHHQNDLCVAAGRNHAFAVGNGVGDGLVHKDMLAVPGGQQGLFGMQGVGSGQMDPLEIVPFEEGLVTPFPGAPELFAEGFAFFSNRIKAGDQFHFFTFQHGRADGTGPCAGADDCQPDFFGGHYFTSTKSAPTGGRVKNSR